MRGTASIVYKTFYHRRNLPDIVPSLLSELFMRIDMQEGWGPRCATGVNGMGTHRCGSILWEVYSAADSEFLLLKSAAGLILKVRQSSSIGMAFRQMIGTLRCSLPAAARLLSEATAASVSKPYPAQFCRAVSCGRANLAYLLALYLT